MARLVLAIPAYLVLALSAVAWAQTDSSQSSAAQAGLDQPSPARTDSQASQPAAGKSWRDFFRSTRRKREQLQAGGDYESLAAETGNAAWSAASQFRQGDYESAIESFAELPGEEALYNSATAHAHAGDYKQSIEQFDRLLQQNPQHEDAMHNRTIVEQLQNLQEQQEQQQQQGEGEQEQQQQDSESQSGEGGGQQQPQDSEQQQGEQSENADQSQQQPGAEAEQPNAQPDLEQLQQAQESAEQQQQARQQEQELEQQRQQALQELAEEMPMNEQQQATEQWLRLIPDDPSGLLRRRLERSHMTDHSRVTDSEQPW